MERTTKLNSVGESMENCRSAFSLVCEAIEGTSMNTRNGYSRSLVISENDYQILFNEVKLFWDSLNDGTNRFGMNVEMWNDAAENNSTDALIGFLEFRYPSSSNTSRPGLLYALEEHDDGFRRGFSATNYYGDSEYSDKAITSAFKSIFRALNIPMGKLPSGSPEQRIRNGGDVFDWNLKTDIKHDVGESDETKTLRAKMERENIPQMFNEEEGTVALTPGAEAILKRDGNHLGSFMGNIDQDEQFVNKNGMFVASDYSRSGLLGQANLIALLQKLEDAGFDVGVDFGILCAGGAGKWYYLWYNKNNANVVNLIADVEKSIEDYPVVDEALYSEMECAAADVYWDKVMDNNQKIQYYKDHGAEVNPEWENEDFNGVIEKPDFFDDNGDITSEITTEFILGDDDLRKYELAPESYFV